MFENGSKFLKLDAHMHTKSDKEFSYSGLGNSFVNDYIAELVLKDIRVGFITNHNKFDLDEFKALKKRSLKEDIFLLPGIELSVKEGANGIHVLVIFKLEDWVINGKDNINTFLDTAFIGVSSDRCNENTRCKYDLNGMFNALDEYNSEYFVIPAHVEQNSGLLKECNGGLIESLSRNQRFKDKVLALQKVRTRDLHKNFKDWTKMDCPNIEGSDNKTISSIGEKYSYIKIGEYSFDAIKFALMDYKDRLCKEIVANKHAFIEKISVKGGKLDGQTINLSANLNCLIGIRGSGKSSVLEIIRTVLGKSATCDDEYKNNLVNYIIGSGGKVELRVNDRYGKNYSFSYINGERVNIYDQSGSLTNVTTDAIISRPLYFGQKDLSLTKPGYELSLLNKLIGDRVTPLIAEVCELEKQIDKIISDYNSLSEQSIKTQQIKERNGNLEHFLTIFAEHGVVDKLKKQTSYILDQQQIENIIKSFELLNFGKVDSNIKSMLDKIYEYEKYNSEYNKKYFDNIVLSLKKVAINLDNIKSSYSNLNTLRLQFYKEKTEFAKIMNGLKEEFAEIKREIQNPEIDPDKYLKYKQEYESNQREITRIQNLLAEKDELKRKILSLHDSRNNKLIDIYSIYNKEIQKINDSQSELKIEIEFKRDKGSFLSILKNLLRGTGITETKYKVISDEYLDLCDLVVDVALDSIRNNTKEILTFNELGKIQAKIHEISLDMISSRTPDKVSIIYHGKPLEKHSLGQRASALILFILTQDINDIIIIDQPEDDLDNQVIYSELIHRIRKRKTKIQFIFATHNANIPVLGDAERIISCKCDDEIMKLEHGNIDKTDTQNDIINIMEGGFEAFEKRKRIYSVWR